MSKQISTKTTIRNLTAEIRARILTPAPTLS